MGFCDGSLRRRARGLVSSSFGGRSICIVWQCYMKLNLSFSKRSDGEAKALLYFLESHFGYLPFRFKVPEKDKIYVSAEKISDLTEKLFKSAGVSDEGARNSTNVLIGNDLRGVESHGVSNGLRLYLERYSSGSYNSKPVIYNLIYPIDNDENIF